jgi:colanic acid/amylovoran biosynthesis glycosyltransferase
MGEVFLNTHKQVAIITGSVPSTTFIEQLIRGLAAEGVCLLVLGKLEGTLPMTKGVRYVLKPCNRLRLGLGVLHSLFCLLGSGPASWRRLACFVAARKRKKRALDWWTGLTLLRLRPEIIHVQWAKSFAPFLCLKGCFPFHLLGSLRGYQVNVSPVVDPRWRQTYQEVFPHLDAFHAVSKAIASEALRYGADPARIRVIPPAVAEDLLAETLPEERFVGPMRLLVVGRDHWKKGFRETLILARTLKTRQIPFSLTLVCGRPSEELLFLRHQWGLQAQVQFLGAVPHHQILKLMRQSDVLLLNSFEEGIANVVLEAMAVGTLVVSTDCGGMAEVIEDGVNGFLVARTQQEAMADVVQKIMTLPPAQRRHIREGARETIKQHHTLTTQVRAMKELYASLPALEEGSKVGT